LARDAGAGARRLGFVLADGHLGAQLGEWQRD